MAKKGLKKVLEVYQANEKATQPKKKSVKKTQVVEPEVQEEVEEEQVETVQDEEPEDYQTNTLSKKEQRKLKKQLKKQQEQEQEQEEDDDEEEEDEDFKVDLDKLADSASESEIEDNEEDEDDEEEDEEADPEAEEEDVALSDVEIDEDADVVPHHKLTINNVAALKELLARIQLPWAKHAFTEHQLVVSSEKVTDGIKDIYDDTERELAFYKQGLEAVKEARKTLIKLNVPFSRPMDYFAEMVKLDEHMERLKQKLMSEAANKKALEDAKKQRHLKKFGKQVQHETLQERAKQKKEALGKIDQLKKRKRGAGEMTGDDEFDVALEDSQNDKKFQFQPDKRAKVNGKRQAKNSKFGFGGMKRNLRKNDSSLSMDVSSANKKKQRPGKSRRRH